MPYRVIHVSEAASWLATDRWLTLRRLPVYAVYLPRYSQTSIIYYGQMLDNDLLNHVTVNVAESLLRQPVHMRRCHDMSGRRKWCDSMTVVLAYTVESSAHEAIYLSSFQQQKQHRCHWLHVCFSDVLCLPTTHVDVWWSLPAALGDSSTIWRRFSLRTLSALMRTSLTI